MVDAVNSNDGVTTNSRDKTYLKQKITLHKETKREELI